MVHGDMVAVLVRRLAASDLLPAYINGYPAHELTLLALSHLAKDMYLLLPKVEQQTSRPLLSSEQLAGLLTWSAAVVAAAPVVLASAGQATHEKLCTVMLTVAIAHLSILSARNGNSTMLAGARAEAHRQLPALVHACAHAAGRLPAPGEALPVCNVQKVWRLSVLTLSALSLGSAA